MFSFNSKTRLAFKTGWQIFHSDGKLIFWSHMGKSFATPDELGAKYRLLSLLDGEQSYASVRKTICQEYKDLSAKDVDNAIVQLAKDDLIEDMTYGRPINWSSEELTFYDRQFFVFGGHSKFPESRYDMQQRLRNATVLIIGVGGVGTWLTCLLARTGIGHLILIDPDQVEFSNLNRQMLYSINDIGVPKVTVAQQKIAQSNPFCKVTPIQKEIKTQEDLIPLTSEVDLVIQTVTSLNSQLARTTSHACLDANIPHMFASGKWIGPLCIPGKTACYGCVEALFQKEFSLYHEVVDSWVSRQVRNHSAFAPFLAPAATLAGLEAVKFISKIGEEALFNKIVQLDFDLLTLEPKTFSRTPDCLLCSNMPSN